MGNPALPSKSKKEQLVREFFKQRKMTDFNFVVDALRSFGSISRVKQSYNAYIKHKTNVVKIILEVAIRVLIIWLVNCKYIMQDSLQPTLCLQ